MIFPKTMIENCAAIKDYSRPYLQNPYLDVEGKQLIATDGHKLVFVPVVPEDGDVSGYVTGKALAAARKLAKRTEPSIRCNGALELTDGTVLPRPENQAFPVDGVKRVIPDTKGCKIVSFNAQLLLDIAKAIGEGKDTIATVVILHLPEDNTRAIKVTKSGTEAFGVLMPVRME